MSSVSRTAVVTTVLGANKIVKGQRVLSSIIEADSDVRAGSHFVKSMLSIDMLL